MTVRLLLAALHLLALGIGLGAVVGRGRALKRVRGAADLGPVFVADNWWGVASLLWLVTGLLRAFGAYEKGSAYYLAHPLFHAKLGLFVLIFALEIWPMITLLRWRGATRRGQEVHTSASTRLAAISNVEAAVVVVMVFLAVAIARGFGS